MRAKNRGFSTLEIREQKNERKRQRRFLSLTGFTLVELVISIGIFLIFLEVFYFYFFSSIKFHRYGFENVDVVQNARLATDRVVRELRLATSLSEIGASAIRFNADVGSGSEDIRYYFYDPGSDNVPSYYIYRAVNYASLGDGQSICVVLPDSGTPYPAATASTWVGFSYYDSSGAVTAVMADVRMVAVYLMVENNQNYLGVGAFRYGTSSDPYKNTEFRTKVYLRNANN
ncbi:MAG: prepilin-type N-terminal cleavage/methylation domain-containing protein [Candidatus Omnitrophica bacterium]|nr:prepilin-type N-terminal cleavage/methylation domain-containing protein [Candidatus Omnitrophota bacterium]